MPFADILKAFLGIIEDSQQTINNSPLNTVVSTKLDIVSTDDFLSNIKLIKTPNQNTRTEKVKSIVLHHTGPGTMQGTIDWLCNKAAKASCHYLIDVNGDIVSLGSPDARLWHVGVSYWNFAGEESHDVNNVSVGIELLNPGLLIRHSDGKLYLDEGENGKEFIGTAIHGSVKYPNGHVVAGDYEPYPSVQLEACVKLCKALVEKYPAIVRENVLRHLDVAMPMGRKNDPFGLDFEALKDKIFS